MTAVVLHLISGLIFLLTVLILTSLLEDDPYKELNGLIGDMRRALRELWELIEFKRMEKDFKNPDERGF